MVQRYRSRIDAALESFDLHVELTRPYDWELRSTPGESSADVAKRVSRAREHGAGTRFLSLASESEKLLNAALERKRVTASSINVAVRIASTIAILDDNAPEIRAPHVAEAIQYCPR
jgi:predicted ATPase with chaperone activity